MRSQTFALASESSTSTKHLRSLAHIKILCRYTDMHRADIGTRHTLHVKGAKLTVNPIQTLQSHLSNKRSRLPPIQVARPEIQQTSKTSAPSRREGRDAASKGRRQTQKQKRHSDILEAKRNLQFATAGTFRGGLVTSTQRAVVEEAIIDLEAYGHEIDFEKLEGLWRLIYTTALDVAPLVMPPNPFAPVRVGNVYQRFGSLESGLCQNIIKASVPFLLEEDDGVTIKVGVHYESRSPRRIALKFQEAGVSDVHITSLTETLIAPALLPRGWLQQRILLALKELNINVTLPFARQRGTGGQGDYLLSFLDETMLVGRAQNGTFVFIRDS